MGWTIEADGGSRGNPGPAAYGAALLLDGLVVAARGETIGRATNNVAEYRGLIAGLELAREHAGDAPIEVRMDSKLVVEQMAGRWKIKHPDMKPLALQANQIARDLGPITWTWVPRAQNARADALANQALDAEKAGRPGLVTEGSQGASDPDDSGMLQFADEPPEAPAALAEPARGWSPDAGAPTRLVLVRHGVTTMTERKLFSGSGGANPPLTDDGVEQARRAAAWIHRHGGADAIVASPLVRTRQTADHVASALGLAVTVDDGLAEADFGDWDGHSFAQIMERWPSELDAWLASTAVAPPGGETFDAVLERVDAARQRLLDQYAGRTVVVVSHVTPIKLLVKLALDAPIEVIHRMELAPASITEIAWFPDGLASLRSFSIVP